MKGFSSICLMFVLTAFLFSYSPPVSAIGFHPPTTKLAKGYPDNAASFALATDVYAISVGCIFQPTDAATHAEVAILVKTPTVEVKAKTTVGTRGSWCYQRVLKFNDNKFNLANCRTSLRYRGLHIDPGLRGC